MNNSVLICGKTGSSKSNTVLANIEDEQVVVLDIQKRSTAWRGFCLKGGVYEDLDSQRGLPLKIDFQNSLDREDLLEALLDRRGSTIDLHPQLETVTDYFFQLCQGDMRTCQRIFRRGDEFLEALERADRDVREWWASQPGGVAWERITAPTERLTRILTKPAIASRISNDDSFLDVLRSGQSYFVDGGDVITEAEVRFILKLRLKTIIRYMKQGGSPLTVVLEESEAAGLITPQVVNALLTMRKRNLRFVIVCQEASWGDERLTEAVLQNTQHVWHAQGGEITARTAAADLLPMLNPRAIKEIQERFVAIGDQQFIETRNIYFSLEEQQKRMMQWLLNLQRGQAFSRSGSQVRFLQIPEIHVSERQSTVLPRLNWDEPERNSSDNSSTSTQPRSRKQGRSVSDRMKELFGGSREKQSEKRGGDHDV